MHRCFLSDINFHSWAVDNVENRHSIPQVKRYAPLGNFGTGAGSEMEYKGLRVIEKIDYKLPVKSCKVLMDS